ncbi:MAG: M67 family metallopeptidase [Chloroflexi bacterium]|nr:M67 family metallopeptidase [Chloroflexota bacterium]
MVEHARYDVPNECCGMLAGKGDRVSAVWRATNAQHSPTRYSLDPQDILRGIREADKAGCELIGFYHSHTHTEAYPSKTDMELAFWPECRYVIVSLIDSGHPTLRAFWIADGKVTEDVVEVSASPDA